MSDDDTPDPCPVCDDPECFGRVVHQLAVVHSLLNRPLTPSEER